MCKFSFWILLFSILGFSMTLCGQNRNKIDSLHAILDTTTIDSLQMKLYYKLGKYNYLDNNYHESIRNYDSSLVRAKQINKLSAIATLHEALGSSYSALGLFDKAYENHSKALEIEEERKNDAGISKCLKNVGAVHYTQGDNIKAISYFLKALKIDNELGDKKEIASTYRRIGVAYYGHSRFRSTYQSKKKYLTRAREYTHKALEIYQDLNYEYGLANCYATMAMVYQNIDSPNVDIRVKANSLDTALIYLFKQKEIVEKSGNKKEHADIYRHLGSTYASLHGLVRQGLERDTDYYTLALENAFRSYDMQIEIGSIWSIKSISKFLAGFLYKEGDLANAEKFFLDVLRLDNFNTLMNFSFSNEEEKERFFITVKSDYMKFNSFALLYKDKKPEITTHVYDFVLKNKGLLLKSSTSMRSAVLNSKDTSLINKYEEWIGIKKELSGTYMSTNKELEEKANSLERELVKSSQIFSDFKKIQEITWKDVRENLKPGEAAIEFLDFNYKGHKYSGFTDSILYCALILRPDSKYPEMISLFDRRELKKIFSENSNNDLTSITNIYGSNVGVNTKLYELIWKPLEKSLEGINTIYISPSGMLNQVSFAAIAKNNSLYLSDIYNINMLYSTSAIAFDRFVEDGNIDIKNDFNACIFGGIDYNTENSEISTWNFLEGTKVETETIYKLFQKKKVAVDFYSGLNATESELKEKAEKSKLIHISTHGFFYPDPRKVKKNTETKAEYGTLAFRGSKSIGTSNFVENSNPLMRSGLVFARANNVWTNTENKDIDDGVLTAQEVLTLNMKNTELVVMSACETGLGDVVGSEGVYGLQRAFKMAGVRFLIMSLWQVPDKETVEFMTNFYASLLKTKDIKKSFRITQNTMRMKYSPYFWAAFVLIE